MERGYASHRALAYLTQNNPFQPCRADLDERLTALGLSVAEATSASPATTPGKDGKRAADNLIAARRTDGSNQAGNYADTTGYRPVNTPDTLVDPWRWQPVRVPLGDPNGTPRPRSPPSGARSGRSAPSRWRRPSRHPTRSRMTPASGRP